jgi:Flp pilus assembly protein TadD
MTTSISNDDIHKLINDGNLDDAAHICAQGLEQTGDTEFIYLLSVIRAQQNQLEEAIKLCEDAIQKLPNRADVAYTLGVIYFSANNLERAVAAWQRTYDIDPDHQDAIFNAAVGLSQLGRDTESQKLYERLLEDNPKNEMALYNYANLKVRMKNPEMALPLFQQLLDLNPDFDAGWVNYGLAAQRTGDLSNAKTYFNKALLINTQSVEAHWNLAHLLLIEGNWRDGFAEYEWRLERPEAPKPEWPQPAWDGILAADQTLLLWIDQGVGDAIQFLRYARFAAERVGTVILRCQESLVSLAITTPGIDTVIAIEDPLPAFNFHAPLMSLAHLLNQTEPKESWHGPYISARQDFNLEAAQNTRKIGIVWAGNPAHRNDANRSCSLAILQPLLQTPNSTFFSLQVGPGRDEELLSLLFNSITDLAPRLNDFSDTAAAIQSLDLVISVDTAVAHLAGALGKPTWLMIPAIDPDWRWLLEQTDTAWYPSARLFRQSTPGDWTKVIADMAAALKNL